MEKPLDVLQDLYQKADLVRSILSLLLDAMTAGCDPMENALCGDNIPHGGDGGGDRDGTFGSNGGVFRERRKAQKTDV